MTGNRPTVCDPSADHIVSTGCGAFAHTAHLCTSYSCSVTSNPTPVQRRPYPKVRKMPYCHAPRCSAANNNHNAGSWRAAGVCLLSAAAMAGGATLVAGGCQGLLEGEESGGRLARSNASALLFYEY